MSDWKLDLNKRAVAIVRRSSQGQKENTSAETQQRDIRAYCEKHGLEIVKLESIIETAYKGEDRKKYRALMLFAQAQGIKHILFYIGSREARNLTDNEDNERLIKEDKLIIHHVSDNKVYWKGSPDSDFLNRDLIAAVNKHQSRENGTKMKASYRTKAEAGWFPYRHTPLGYIHTKDKDAIGNPIKGTAKVSPHPDPAIVQLVQAEFHLRSQGYSYEAIRAKNLSDGIVPDKKAKTYSHHAIEGRLKNPLYWGYFFLTGDEKRYEGKHSLIIDPKILKAVKAINEGRIVRRSKVANGEDIFRGWLSCGHPGCKRAVTYERKEKKLKSTGEAKIYHLYRCNNNSKNVHPQKVYLSEDKIWEQLEPAVDSLSITQDFANDIAAALNETHAKAQAAIKKQMEGFSAELRKLEGREDEVYTDLKRGVLDEVGYQRQIERVRDERRHYEEEIKRLTLAIGDEAMVSVKKVFELAINAKSLWNTMERKEKLAYLDRVVFEPKLNGLSVEYQLQKPFATLAKMKGTSKWRRERDSNSRVDFRPLLP